MNRSFPIRKVQALLLTILTKCQYDKLSEPSTGQPSWCYGNKSAVETVESSPNCNHQMYRIPG